MIIVKLGGGLGNQMFQYAFAKYLALKHDTTLKVDIQSLLSRKAVRKSFVFRNYDLDIFNITPQLAEQKEVDAFKRSSSHLTDKVLTKLLGFKKGYIHEPHFHFSKSCFAAPDNAYLDGYWQSEKYFSNISDQLKQQDFSFKQPLQPGGKELLAEISSSNAVCLNVRRGDFVTNSFHGTCSIEYYQKAEEMIRAQVTDPTFYVFSDEIEWCRNNLLLQSTTKYIGHEYAGTKFQDYLRLMAACKHFIIPNSTFAWWAVWFNNNKDKIVIAPKNWFGDNTIKTTDLTSPNWLLI